MATPYDMANMTVTGTPSTGPFTLDIAVSGYQTFAAAGVPNGAVINYGVTDTGGAWEIGQNGTYDSTGPTLTRNPIFSSNGNAAISATSAATVRVVLLAEDILKAPAAGLVSSNGTVLATATLGTGITLVGNTLNVSGASTSAFVLAAAILSTGPELGAI